MSDVTTNYGLEKPLGSENYDIQVQNRNMDKADIKLKGNADAIVTNAEALASHSADYTRNPGYAVDTGVANAYVVTLDPAPTAYVDGMMINVKIIIQNTGTSTINVNGLGVKSIYKANYTALLASDILPNRTYTLVYSTSFVGFILIGGDLDAVKLGGIAASGYATAAQGTLATNAATQTSLNTHLAENAIDRHNATSISVADTAAHFTGTNTETVLAELFTFANDGKTGIASAVTAKGVAASSADTFPTLATKIGQITTQSILTGNMIAGDLLSGKTGYSNNPLTKITGTIPSKAVATITPSTANQTIAAGQYLSGAQTIAGDADLVAGNIKSGANIFGVVGTVTVASLGGKLPFTYIDDVDETLGDFDGTYQYTYNNRVPYLATVLHYEKRDIHGTVINDFTLPATNHLFGGMNTRYGIVEVTASNTVQVYSHLGVLIQSAVQLTGIAYPALVAFIAGQYHVIILESSKTEYRIYSVSGTLVSTLTYTTYFSSIEPTAVVSGGKLLVNYQGGILYINDSGVLTHAAFDSIEFGVLYPLFLK